MKYFSTRNDSSKELKEIINRLNSLVEQAEILAKQQKSSFDVRFGYGSGATFDAQYLELMEDCGIEYDKETVHTNEYDEEVAYAWLSSSQSC